MKIGSENQMTDKMEGIGKYVPPKFDHVMIYFLQKGQSEERAEEFFEHYNSRDWKNFKGTTLSNWKSTAWEWILKSQLKTDGTFI